MTTVVLGHCSDNIMRAECVTTCEDFLVKTGRNPAVAMMMPGGIYRPDPATENSRRNHELVMVKNNKNRVGMRAFENGVGAMPSSGAGETPVPFQLDPLKFDLFHVLVALTEFLGDLPVVVRPPPTEEADSIPADVPSEPSAQDFANFVKEIEDAADKIFDSSIRLDQTVSDVAKVSATTGLLTAIGGGVMIVVGIVGAPLSGGASLALTAGGIALAVGTTVTDFGAQTHEKLKTDAVSLTRFLVPKSCANPISSISTHLSM